MAEDQAHDEWCEIETEIDADLYEKLEEKASLSGRTVSAQLVYELKVNRGLVNADPHDEEARLRGQVFRRIHARQPLHG